MTNELDGKVVVKQLIDRGTLIKVQDETGNAIEDYGIFGGWTNNIGNFKPGEGYKIKVTNNETLILLSERGVCPVGWHLPSDAEWSALSNYLINNGYGYEGSGTDIAKSLVTKTNWSESTIPGTPGKDPAGNNSSGFSGLPGGARHISAIFSGIGGYAYWWSSQRNNASDAWDRDMHYHGTGLSRGYFSKDYGFNVRCVRD